MSMNLIWKTSGGIMNLFLSFNITGIITQAQKIWSQQCGASLAWTTYVWTLVIRKWFFFISFIQHSSVCACVCMCMQMCACMCGCVDKWVMLFGWGRSAPDWNLSLTDLIFFSSFHSLCYTVIINRCFKTCTVFFFYIFSLNSHNHPEHY